STVGKTLVTPEVREAIAGNELPTYLLVIPRVEVSAAQMRVLLARVAHELDEQAVFYALDESSLVSDYVHKSDQTIINREYNTQTPQTMLETVDHAANHVNGERKDLASDVL